MWQSSRRRAGWLEQPWVWGEGSVVWLTAIGIECAGIGGVRPVKAPPAPTTIAHGVLVGVVGSARRAECGRVWKSSARARPRPRALGGADAVRARLHRTAARPRGLARTSSGATRRGDRRERRTPRGSTEDDPQRLARRDRVRTLRRRALRLRERIRRALDRPPRQEGLADWPGVQRSRANERRRRSPPSRPSPTMTVRIRSRTSAQQTPPARSPLLNRATSPRLRLRSPQSPWRRCNPRRSCWHLKRRRPQPSASGATARSSVYASQSVADPGDDEGAQAHCLQASEYRAVASGFPHPDRTYVGRAAERCSHDRCPY